MTEQATSYIIGHIIFTAIVLLSTMILSIILKKTIDAIFLSVRKRVISGYLIAKTRTIRSVLKNTTDGILYLMALLIILANWGLNIGPILTGAGILGLAISFGSQTLVKDLIAGFFIIFEGQYNIGDTIKIIDKYEGKVEKLTLRLTILRDSKGNMIYIPNSQILAVIKKADK